MLLYIAEGHLHFILLSTTQTQLFSVKMHTLNKCIFEIISCFAKEQINMKLEIDSILVKLRLFYDYCYHYPQWYSGIPLHFDFRKNLRMLVGVGARMIRQENGYSIMKQKIPPKKFLANHHNSRLRISNYYSHFKQVDYKAHVSNGKKRSIIQHYICECMFLDKY